MQLGTRIGQLTFLKKILLIGIIIFFSQKIQALDFREQDKQKHFISSFAITSLAGIHSKEAIYLSFSIGFFKEIYDWQSYGLFDWEDIEANALGVGFALGINWTLRYYKIEPIFFGFRIVFN